MSCRSVDGLPDRTRFVTVTGCNVSVGSSIDLCTISISFYNISFVKDMNCELERDEVVCDPQTVHELDVYLRSGCDVINKKLFKNLEMLPTLYKWGFTPSQQQLDKSYLRSKDIVPIEWGGGFQHCHFSFAVSGSNPHGIRRHNYDSVDYAKVWGFWEHKCVASKKARKICELATVALDKHIVELQNKRRRFKYQVRQLFCEKKVDVL